RDETGSTLFEYQITGSSAIRSLAWHPVDTGILTILNRGARVFGVRFSGNAVEPVFYIDTEEEFGTGIAWNSDGTLLGIRGQKGMGAGEDVGIQVWQNWVTPVRVSRLTIPDRIITGLPGFA